MNEEKFTGKAEIYAKYRPSYPDELIDWLFERTQAKNVADIGAGTGIFTECLLKRFKSVTAVEPNDDMLKVLRKSVGDRVNIVKAPAESTNLESGQFGLVTTAQAFHWFDKPKFKKECQRILKWNGMLAVIWNERVQNDVANARNEVCMKYCGAYHSGHVDTGYKDFDGDTFLRNEYFSEMEYFRIENNVTMTKEHFIGDNLSRSYALKEGDENYSDFVSELESVFDKFNKDGFVEIPYMTTCYLGKF